MAKWKRCHRAWQNFHSTVRYFRPPFSETRDTVTMRWRLQFRMGALIMSTLQALFANISWRRGATEYDCQTRRNLRKIGVPRMRACCSAFRRLIVKMKPFDKRNNRPEFTGLFIVFRHRIVTNETSVPNIVSTVTVQSFRPSDSAICSRSFGKRSKWNRWKALKSILEVCCYGPLANLIDGLRIVFFAQYLTVKQTTDFKKPFSHQASMRSF
jgi:hypothetical protein